MYIEGLGLDINSRGWLQSRKPDPNLITALSGRAALAYDRQDFTSPDRPSMSPAVSLSWRVWAAVVIEGSLSRRGG